MHVPVMLRESLGYLGVRPDGVYLDATCGLGGHTGAIARELTTGLVLACDRELNFNRDRLNVNGGAIALGHPIGCTGTRITVTLVHEMLKRNTRRGVATVCVSGGLGMALALENVV